MDTTCQNVEDICRCREACAVFSDVVASRGVCEADWDEAVEDAGWLFGDGGQCGDGVFW